MSRDPTGPYPLEMAFGAIASLAMIAGAWAWATACLAGVLFGKGQPALSLADAVSSAIRLPQHLEEPATAYPAATRAVLPGAAGWWMSGAIVSGICGGCIAAVVMLVGRLRASGDARTAATWARGHELRPITVRSPQTGRVTLGRHGRRLLAAEAGQSVLVVAPTQTGKTTGLAIPAILEWRGPVLATSVKTDLLRDTVAARRAVGRVLLFDPGGETGFASAVWSPVDGCTDWTTARRTAAWLAEGASLGRRGSADADFWYATAAKLLAPMLFAAARGGASMADVVAWIDTQAEDVVMEILEASGCVPAINAMQASVMRDERQRSSVYTTAETILEAYADPGLLEAKGERITAAELLDGGPHTLYLSSTVR